jgi:hypothetical protein
MTIYIVYKTTNLINGKYYIGKHATDNINDSYLGSGKALKRAIKKYGKENFKREILAVFNNESECYLAEEQLVDPTDTQSYNTAPGGLGGAGKMEPWNKGKKMSTEYCDNNRRVQKEVAKTRDFSYIQSEEYRAKLRKPKSERHGEKVRQARLGKTIPKETRKKISESLTGRTGNRKGAVFSEEHRRKLSEAAKRTKGKRPKMTEEQRKKLSESVKKSWEERKEKR